MPKKPAFLPYQQAIIAHRDAGNSLRAIGRASGVDIKQLSRVVNEPGYIMAPTVAMRLFDHVPNLLPAYTGDTGVDIRPAGAPGPSQPASTGPRDIVMLRPDQLVPWEKNPRKTFGAEEISQLADNIAERGVLQNLIVRKQGDAYEIGGGERRWRACSLLVKEGRKHPNEAFIPCRIVEAADEELLSLAIIENLQRVEVSPLEEAEGFATLYDFNPKYWSAEKIAQRVSKSAGFVQQRLRLARSLIGPAKDALREGRLTFDKARMLSRQDKTLQTRVIEMLGEDRAGRHLRGTTEEFTKHVEYMAALPGKEPSAQPTRAPLLEDEAEEDRDALIEAGMDRARAGMIDALDHLIRIAGESQHTARQEAAKGDGLYWKAVATQHQRSIDLLRAQRREVIADAKAAGLQIKKAA